MHELHNADYLGGEVNQAPEEIPEVRIEGCEDLQTDDSGEQIDTSVITASEYPTEAELLEVAAAHMPELVDPDEADDESVQSVKATMPEQTAVAKVERPTLEDDADPEGQTEPSQPDETVEPASSELEPHRPRELWKSSDPHQLNSYRIAQGAQYRPGEITVPEDSPLAGGDLEVISRSWIAETTDKAVLRYPGRLEVLKVETGKRELLAEAVWHESQRPEPTNVISPEGVPEIEMPERAHDQRPHYLPPDEIRIDEIPAEREEVAAAVEVMLRAYAADAMKRTTYPDPSTPGIVALNSEMKRYIDDSQPIPREVFEEALLGEQPIGITRLQLSDPQSNLDARRDNFDTPAVNGTLDALNRLHCEPVSFKSVRVESSDMRAIEIGFRRREGTTQTPEATIRMIGELESWED